MKRLALLLTCVTLFSIAACSKNEAEKEKTAVGVPEVQEDHIDNSVLKNCRFQVASPTYTLRTTITPNPIICDEGVAKKVELLTPAPLPGGLSFSMSQLSLVGTPNEKLQTPTTYKFYIENEAGYAILNLQLAVH